MSRGATRRAWIKLFVTGWLHGSIRWELTPAERGTFADLLVLAGECGRDGEISDNDGKAFPFAFIANQLNISEDLLNETLNKCERANRVIVKDGVFFIVNWRAYQSEYDRQKKYRQGSSGEIDPEKYKRGRYAKNVRR